MRFLIAGLGSIGRRHLRNLHSLGQDDIVLYRTHRSTLEDGELEGLPVETDLDAALARSPDAVIVSNPTALHLDVAIPAARAGCHLLLEKPVSHSYARLDELQAAVLETGSQVLVGYQFRHHPGLQNAARLLAERAIGRPVTFRFHWGEYLPGWHPWEDYRQGYSARSELGGGVILTLSHPIDYLRWLLGEVCQLAAMSGQLSDLDLQVEDTAELLLRLENGAIGSLHLDYVQQPAGHHLTVVGTDGSLTWDNDDGALRLFQARAADGGQVFPPPEGFDRNDLFLAEMRHFIEVVRGRAEPVCTLEDGRRALLICQAAKESAAAGQVAELQY